MQPNPQDIVDASALLEHNADDLITIFNQCFIVSHQTVLKHAVSEPIYLPMGAERMYHEIHFAHGYFASALHEIAHWCIAGPQRRLLEDYGYWYAPDGRNKLQQKKFEQVEVKPQALEYLFSQACNFTFNIAADNLALPEYDTSCFAEQVFQQAECYKKQGLPSRAQVFKSALEQYFGIKKALDAPLGVLISNENICL